MLTCLAHLAPPPTMLAHAGGGGPPTGLHDLWRAWGEDPTVWLGLALAAWLYARGLLRIWRVTGIGRGVRRWEAACFAGGWMTLFIALVSPLHPWGEALFSVHMIQHELLMLVAAPLLVLGRPMVVLLAALPGRWSGGMVRLSRLSPWRFTWRLITNAFVAWMIHAALLWLWHAPALMDAVLESGLIHALQHICFLGSALLFWWAIIQGGRTPLGLGVAVLYIFTTAIHSTMLGLLIAFASRVLYTPYAGRSAAWGLTALEDQQVGGFIMAIPACLTYIIAGLALFAGWMRQSELRALAREARERSAAHGAGDARDAQAVAMG